MSEAELRVGYRRCAALTRRHGTTYYWGAAILPTSRRRHVYAVYALCRLADDIVDLSAETGRGERLAAFADAFRSVLAGAPAPTPELAAIAHTVRERRIDPECFDRFFGAMAMDLTVDRYETWDDLCGYMEGSAAVIGEMMLPVLEPLDPRAYEPARALGLAFQLTNFLRDVGEDLDRGRIYLPQQDLAAFGADPELRRVTPGWRALMAYEIRRNRELYRQADVGIGLLPSASARCVATARVLYARILDRIEAADYDVFTRRARVATMIKAATAARVLVAGPPRGDETGCPRPGRTRTMETPCR